MDKYEDGTYHKDYFNGGSNSDINLIMCEDNNVILSKLQSYVLHWYHTYLLHPGMDRTEEMIRQHVYWPGIRHAVRKEVNNCDTCQHYSGVYRNQWASTNVGKSLPPLYQFLDEGDMYGTNVLHNFGVFTE